MLEKIDASDEPETYFQYLGALQTMEDPRSSIAAIQSAIKMIGDLSGLYKRRFDITSHREKEDMTPEEFAATIAQLPDMIKAKLMKDLDPKLLEGPDDGDDRD